MVDYVIQKRVGYCDKVSLVTHGSSANSSLIAASTESLGLSARVGKIVNLAPCLNVSLNNFWLPVQDLASIAAFYEALKTAGINQLYGPMGDADPNLQAYCNSGDNIAAAICNAYIYPGLNNPLLKQTSMKDFQHIQQNTAISQFRPYESDVADLLTPKEYATTLVNIPVHAILSQLDEACPSDINLELLTGGVVNG